MKDRNIIEKSPRVSKRRRLLVYPCVAVVTLLEVSVRGGVIREVIGAAPAGGASTGASRAAGSGGMEERISTLEQRVKQLEAEVESLKRGRRNQ